MIEAFAAQHAQREYASVADPDDYLISVHYSRLKESGASSIWSSTYDQIKPYSTDTGYWHPAEDSDFPHVIWYKFMQQLSIKKFAFSAIANEYFPRHYILFGSNARDCSKETKWTTLLERKPEDYVGGFTTQEYVDNHQTFKCYGFKFFESGRDLYTKIRNLNFWANACEWNSKVACKKLNGRGMFTTEVCDSGVTYSHRIFTKDPGDCMCCFPNTKCEV